MNDFWKDCAEIEHMIVLLSIISIVITYRDSLYNKFPYRVSILSGKRYVESLIQQHQSCWIQEVFRMPLYPFLQLQSWLQGNTNWRSSKLISVPEKLAMFVETLDRAASNRAVQQRFLALR